MFSWSVVITASSEKARELRRRARRLRRQSKIQDQNTHGESPTNIGNCEPTRGRSAFFHASPPPHVHAQSPALLRHRLVDCADALPALGEHLVRPPSVRRPDPRISK